MFTRVFPYFLISPKLAASKSQLSWGRADQASTLTVIIALGMMTIAPIINFLFSITCSCFDCSINKMINNINIQHLLPNNVNTLVNAFIVYSIWYCFQLILYIVLPGPVAEGHITPAGVKLAYICNGWRAWLLTHIVMLLLCYQFGLGVATFFYDHRFELLWVTTVYGFIAALVFWFKAYLFPTHAADCKFSNSFIYDFYLGIEFNPRWGLLFDWKLFHNTRIGITAWTLINISYAAAQYRQYGFVSNSMILVNILQAVYVLDLFWYEAWYLRTIDIEHDHFGFYLAYGSAAWLPFFYTLQGLYLVHNPIQLNKVVLIIVLLIGCIGYYIFRTANNQKHEFKLLPVDKVKIWGQSPKFIAAPYTTADGKEHHGRLLYSGWWGVARHINYVGDLAMAYSWSWGCGFNHILPWSYAIFLTILLLHRTQRDKKRCAGKYGKAWDQYCQLVPWLLIPKVY